MINHDNITKLEARIFFKSHYLFSLALYRYFEEKTDFDRNLYQTRHLSLNRWQNVICNVAN